MTITLTAAMDNVHCYTFWEWVHAVHFGSEYSTSVVPNIYLLYIVSYIIIYKHFQTLKPTLHDPSAYRLLVFRPHTLSNESDRVFGLDATFLHGFCLRKNMGVFIIYINPSKA